MLVELSVMEQRYQAVLAVVQDGWKVTEVAARLGVSRQSVHNWIARTVRGAARTRPTRRSRLGSASSVASIPGGDRGGSGTSSPGRGWIRPPPALRSTGACAATG